MNFSWTNLPQPFFALAPMEGGTDTVFRQIVKSCGKPDVMFTEFTNCEGLLSEGKEEVLKRLVFDKSEHPIIAQIWGIKPESFYEVAKLLVKLEFDGIDINMGCPEKNVVTHGCCSALINNPSLAKEIIAATRKGGGHLPISVKTRIGFKTIATETWIGFLLQQNLNALTIHLRTQKEMSNVPAHFEELEKIVNLRKKFSPPTVLIANGDIISKSQGKDLAKKYGIEGIMMGRAVFHNPYVFNEKVVFENQSKEQRIYLLENHLDLFENTWTVVHPLSEHSYLKRYPPLKRYFKIYIQEFVGAADLREKLMLTNSIREAREVLAKAK